MQLFHKLGSGKELVVFDLCKVISSQKAYREDGFENTERPLFDRIILEVETGKDKMFGGGSRCLALDVWLLITKMKSQWSQTSGFLQKN